MANTSFRQPRTAGQPGGARIGAPPASLGAPAAPDAKTAAGMPPPAPRRPTWWDENWRVLVILISIFAVLFGIAIIGTNAFTAYRAKQDLETRMGSKMNLIALPPMSVRVGNGRELDIAVKVELQTGVDAATVAPNADRILDRLVDRMSDVPAERLNGADGARFVKDALDSAVRTEFDAGKVKGILVEKLLIR